MRILILGGTGEARELAGLLVAAGHDVTTSLAGRTTSPLLPAGGLRVGKFGGIPGLAAYLVARHIERLVDATHPYAGEISANAVAAAAEAGVPLVRLLRPAWAEPAGAGWLQVQNLAGAAAMLPAGATALVTTGHQGLGHLLARDDCTLLVRLIEPPAVPLPRHARLLLTRPPFTLAGETRLLRRERVTHLISKNSGGVQTEAKLAAAQALGVTVIMVARPAYGPAVEVATPAEAIAALHFEAAG